MRTILVSIAALLLAAPALAPAQTLEAVGLGFMQAQVQTVQVETVQVETIPGNAFQALPRAGNAFQVQALAQPATPAQTISTLSALATIGPNGYTVTNPATFAKTADGLLVVLSPGTLTGIGPLGGHQQGLTLEIPDSFIRQLF